MDTCIDRRTFLAVAAGLLPGRATARPGTSAVVPAVLAVEDDGRMDPSGFLVSEKVDGVRALWDGRALRTRRGLALDAPAAFLARLPPHDALDGELWLGRGTFEAVSGLVRRRRPGANDWDAVRYVVFELPHAPGPFAERARRIADIARRHGAPLLAAVQERVAGRTELVARLAAVVAAGGEGLMLHRADAPFVAGRSPVLVKVKPEQDAEAVVVGHRRGAGRLADSVGSLEVIDQAGRRFRVGSGLDDALRRAPPPIGARITFRHRGLTADGLPRFPTYWRRADPA
jgi:DNA ligase-1